MSVPAEARRCGTCGRFRAYRDGDRFCLVCGSEALDAACRCGRDFRAADADRI